MRIKPLMSFLQSMLAAPCTWCLVLVLIQICCAANRNQEGKNAKASHSLLDYLDPEIVRDDDLLQEISARLQEGELIEIQGAFRPEFAEKVWGELSRSDNKWLRQKSDARDDDDDSTYQFFQNHIWEGANSSSVMKDVNDMFDHPDSRKLMSDLSGATDLFLEPSGISSLLYEPGDFYAPHSDSSNRRKIAFHWDLAKDWDVESGGAFYWCHAKQPLNGYRHAAFNSLFLFVVDSTSLHAVTRVDEEATGKRFSVSGFFSHNDSDDSEMRDVPSQGEGKNENADEDVVYVVDSKSPVATNHEEIKEFEVKENASFLDYLNPAVFQNLTIVAEIKQRVNKGDVVVVKDAFLPDFAEYVWKDLSRDNFPWKFTKFSRKNRTDKQVVDHYYNMFKKGHISSKHLMHGKISDTLRQTSNVFAHPDTKQFMTNLTGKDCFGKFSGAPSLYLPGDSAHPHTDEAYDRSISFLWQLTKDWDKEWGGSFYWLPSKTAEIGYQHSSFNTLIFFAVSPESAHLVTPVIDDARGKRLTYGGWFNAAPISLSLSDPLEELYATKEDRKRLTPDQAEFLCFYLDVESLGNESRKEKLLELQQAIEKEVIYPDIEEPIFALEAIADEGDEQQNETQVYDSDENSTETETLSCDADDMFSIKTNSSWLDYLDPSILEDPAVLGEVAQRLRNGHLVVIRDAFIPEFAEYVWQGMIADYSHFEAHASNQSQLRPWYSKGNKFKKQKLLSFDEGSPDIVAETTAVFEHPSTKRFISDLSGKDCTGHVRTTATEYKPGDYSTFHSDFAYDRSVSFLWQLSKDWDPDLGGAFYWSAAKNVRNGYLHSSFNTLILFKVTTTSVHGVTPVTGISEGRRLTFGGWFNAPHLNIGCLDRIEEIYATPEARSSLTPNAAEEIAYELDIDSVDPIRQQKLLSLRDSIAEEILFPEQIDEPVYIVESANQEESTNIDKDDENFEIIPGSSILDYMDPGILNDDAMLEEIGSHLKRGHLVVIKDAFVHDFAEYVWRDFSREDFDWNSYHLSSQTRQKTHGHNWRKSFGGNFMGVSKETYDVFNHPATKRFISELSNKDCSGKIRGNANFYDIGGYSNPHTDSQRTRTVTFIWHLAKDWNPDWGGAFYWAPSEHPLSSYHHASFNTLFLFHTTALSPHAVTPVADNAKGKRLSYGGQFTATVRENVSTEDPIEEWYSTKEARAQLTVEEAERLVFDLDVDQVTDENRRSVIEALLATIEEEILFPEGEEPIYVLDSISEEK